MSNYFSRNAVFSTHFRGLRRMKRGGPVGHGRLLRLFSNIFYGHAAGDFYVEQCVTHRGVHPLFGKLDEGKIPIFLELF